MATLFQQAAAGQRKAMTALYNVSKGKVFYLASHLLLEERQAREVTAEVYRSIWQKNATVKDEAAFTELALLLAAELCRNKVTQKDSRAFRLPSNRDFSITAIGHAPKDGESLEKSVLGQLPALHRFVVVLYAAGFSEQKIGQVLHTDAKTVSIALGAEPENVTNLTADPDAYNRVTESLRTGSLPVPTEVETKCTEALVQLSAPTEAKKHKKWLNAGLIAVAVCMVAALIVLMIYLARSDSQGDATGQEETESTETTEDAENTQDTTELAQSADDITITHYADIAIEDYGTITVALDAEVAPLTVANFVKLANSGFYDGLTFHRIMEGFMMQGGDPEGTGSGGSDTNITGEFANNGHENNLSHTRGAISMARSDDYNSASSQFFIVQEDSTFLDGDYAAFGYVTEGMDIVDQICQDAQPTDDNGTIPAEEQPVITSITIRDAA